MPAAALSLPAFSSAWRLFIYPASVLIPGGGLTLGLLYCRQEERSARNFGRICLALGLAGALLKLGGGANFHGLQGSESLTQPFY